MNKMECIYCSKYVRNKLVIFFIFTGLCMASMHVQGQDRGSNLWFSNAQIMPQNKSILPIAISIMDTEDNLHLSKQELINGLNSLGDKKTTVHDQPKRGDLVVALGKYASSAEWINPKELEQLGPEGFCIRQLSDHNFTLLTGNTPKAILYAVYHYLRLLQTQNVANSLIDIFEIPAYQKRILNHWDNLDGTVERGYAGSSIWKWDELPQKISYKYREYARANASIGINGTVLNNVNAKPEMLSSEYLQKASIIANELRPYGVQVYLSINFASPMVLGGLENARPDNPKVAEWWNNKTAEIYQLIPDFGGFLVKANSEGQPGPMDYGLTHADGANMLADALIPYDGIVMWRAFVYNPSGEDRAKQAYNEFMPLDGSFRENVIIQVKNGPVDFQPREPFSPLFGAMKKTAVMPELQITQEYLGFSSHLVYLGSLYSEFLQSDTYAFGEGSTVAKVTNGHFSNTPVTGIAGVANIGADENWCGHQFAQSNWYVFGRLAWNPDYKVEKIATDWTRQTFTQSNTVVQQIVDIMMPSHEAVVNYMTPLGLHHLMGWDHHYGPEPWCEVEGARPDWLPTYYHKADSFGIGFNRSSTGSNAVSQYSEPLHSNFDDPASCPDEYLLWFHHIPWGYTMKSGHSLWYELCNKYHQGVDQVQTMQNNWNELESDIDAYRFKEVSQKLAIQHEEAIWWRDACLLYFQTFSKQAFPDNLTPPTHILEELKTREFDFKHHN